MKQISHFLLAVSFCLAADGSRAQALALALPDLAVSTIEQFDALSSYPLPIGPFANGQLPTRVVEGPMRQSAWRVPGSDATTLELLAPLRTQLLEDGFQSLFECETALCGGFDFRFSTVVLPEPEMHVDLGDFRFFAAERHGDIVSIMVSRTARAGFVQIIQLGGSTEEGAILSTSTKAVPDQQSPDAAAPDLPAPSDPTAVGLGAKLMAGGSIVLEDLEFASGTSQLADHSYPSLDELANWLRANPTITIAIVGHTDASGGLEGNIALSRKRAEAVKDRLISVEGLSAAQIEAQGVGYLSPRESNLTESGRKKNRRVEVMVTSTRILP